MQIRRIQQQYPETIDEFYTKLTQDENVYYRSCGTMMLDLIQYLRTDVSGPPLTAATAHHDLVLIEPNEQKRVLCTAWNGRYKISCSAQPSDAAWDKAQIIGYTESVIEAGSMIISALRYAPKEL